MSIEYSERLAEADVEPLVGSVGDSYDNALAETINSLYKAEVIHRRGPCRFFEAIVFATLEWVDWVNNCRLLVPIGNVPPAEAEERYHATHQDQQLQSDPNETASSRDSAWELYDERFCWISEFYLACREMAFRDRLLIFFQIQLARRRDAVPITRNYITEIKDGSA